MKIALVILHGDPARGGAERYTFDLAEALAARGHDVSLIASTLGPPPRGVKCITLETGGLTRLGKYRRFLDALDAHQSHAQYDIVHAMLPVRRCDVYHPHAGLAAEAVATGHLKHAGFAKQSLARLANQLNPKRNAFARVERELLEASNGPMALCLSEYVKTTVRKHYRLPETRLATLFNAVDLAKYDRAARPAARAELRSRLGISTDRIVALIVAQDFARKGVSEAITATSVADARLLLLVIGKDNPRAYQQAARDLGVEDRVLFTGATSDVYSFYAAADFFVLPTRHDPCSLVVLESLAMGVPVISTKQNGACEIMTPGEHGFVLESADDARGLETAMRALCEAPTRERMRANCLALRPRLAYEKHVETLLDIYTRLQQSHNPPA